MPSSRITSMTALIHLLRRIALTCCLLIPQTALAQTIPGQTSPQFTQALTDWLADKDEASLPVFATLARDGNAAARLMLGVIDKDASMQGPWLILQDRADRIALLRAPGGLSGRSWLRQVREIRFAAILMDVLDSRTDLDQILDLVDLGEERAARFSLISLEARQWVGFAEKADDPRFPIATRYLIWREWQKAGDRAAALNAALASLHPGDGQRLLLRAPVAVPDLESWLMLTDLGQPLRQLCQQNCGQTQPSCMRAGLRALGGYRRLASIGTPTQLLISDAAFAASPRGLASVLRRSLSYAHLTESRLRPLRRINACFTDLLAAEGQRY